MIEFPCAWGQLLRVPNGQRGQFVPCPLCGNRCSVPGGQQITADRPDDRVDSVVEDRPRRLDDGPDDQRRALKGKPAWNRSLLNTMSAMIGYVLVGCVMCVLLSLFFTIIAKIQSASGRMTTMNNEKQILLAMHNYHEDKGHLPLAYDLVDDGGGGPRVEGMSWRIAILPYLEFGPLYDRYNPLQPWDSPANQGIQAFAVKTYHDPGDESSPRTATDYQVFVTVPDKEPHSMFNHPRDPHPFVNLTDAKGGLQNTILLAEAPTSVSWYVPRDMAFDPNQPPPKLGRHHAGGSYVGLADCSVKFLPKSFSPATLKQVITRDGNEQIVDPNW